MRFLSSTFIIKTKEKIWTYIKEFFFFQRVIDTTIVQNINYDSTSTQQKLLICYKTKGYFVDVEKYLGRTFVNEIFTIIKKFSELGYCIDIVDCDNLKVVELIREKKYDLIFGFGESFYQITTLQPDAISILYMTENHPEFSRHEEKKRIEYFYERKGKHTKLKRSGGYYKLYHLKKKYNQVITLSEIEPLKHQYKKPYSIFPTGIINLQYIFKIKDHALSRKHFLWLGSSGAIHKGLDLLIDIFENRDDITLHICGLTKPDKKLLNIPKIKNIIDYGHINIKSELFLQLVEKCSYIILPSCSEGFSTSIATGMLHGMIPIVVKDTGFNRLGDNTIFLEDYNLEYINSSLSEVSNYLPEKLNIFNKKVFDFGRKNFTISNFEKEFKKIILEILYQKTESSGSLSESEMV